MLEREKIRRSRPPEPRPPEPRPRVRGHPRPPLLPRPAPPRAAPEQQAATEEEKKTAQQARPASIWKQQASLAAQSLVRWLSTMLAEARRELTEVQLAATSSLAPAEGPKRLQEEPGKPEEPKESAELKEPEEPGEPKEPKESAELKEPEDPGGPEEPKELEEPEEDPDWGEWPPDGDSRPLPSREDRSRRCDAESAAEEDAVTALLEEEARENCDPEPRRIVLTPENIATRGKSTRSIHEKQAVVEEPRGMRRAQEGSTAAKADTVGVRREAERFAEDAKMDPSNCLMETLALRENQEGIRIRRSPGDYAEHLPWVLERVFLQTLCGPGNDEQGRCASSDVRGSGGRCVSSGVRQSGDPGGGPEPEADYGQACGKLLGVLDEIQVLNRATEARMPEPAVIKAQEVPGEQTTVATAASVGEQVQKTARLFNPHGLPPIMWEGGEDESALKDIRKQFAAQRVPAQLRSSFQPEPRHEASSAEHPKEPIQGKVSSPSTIKTQDSIMLADFAATERTRCRTAGEPCHQTRRLPECRQCPRRMRLEDAGELGKQPKWQRR
jgi:hypothetical protein